jgi:hypothetical protein
MDIVVWLRSLGLGKYEAAFRENEIDEAVLPSLTHETLKELGVTAVGHRLKLLDAIAALPADACAQAPSPAVPIAQASVGPPTEAPKIEVLGERRHVTVIFCDLGDRPAFPQVLMPRIGAIWSARIWTPPLPL